MTSLPVPDPTIPPAAIEAALRAAYEAAPQLIGFSGRPKTYEECYGHGPLDHLDDVEEMRAALTAALPHLLGDAAIERLARWVYKRDAEHFPRVGWDAENDVMKRGYRTEACAVLTAALGVEPVGVRDGD